MELPEGRQGVKRVDGYQECPREWKGLGQCSFRLVLAPDSVEKSPAGDVLRSFSHSGEGELAVYCENEITQP